MALGGDSELGAQGPAMLVDMHGHFPMHLLEDQSSSARTSA